MEHFKRSVPELVPAVMTGLILTMAANAELM